MARFYWLVTSRGENSRDSYDAITTACVDICPPIVAVEEKHSRHKSLVESCDSDNKKLIANAVPESTKKSTKYAVNVFEGEESYANFNLVIL